MIGAVVLLPLYVAIRWTGRALPLPLKISHKSESATGSAQSERWTLLHIRDYPVFFGSE